MRRAVVVLLLLASVTVHADKLVVNVGVGGAKDFESVNYNVGFLSETVSSHGPAVQLDVAVRLMDELAAGVHLGFMWFPYTSRSGNIPGADTIDHDNHMASQIGVSALYSRRRLWLAPWLGLGVTELGTRHFALGASTGFDVYVSPCGHRVGVYVDVSDAVLAAPPMNGRTFYPADSGAHRYVSAGIAYRYW